MRKYNYIVSVIMMALGGYILYEASAYEIGTSAQKNPALWLQFLAGALILLSVALIIETIFSHAPEMDTVLIDWKSWLRNYHEDFWNARCIVLHRCSD